MKKRSFFSNSKQALYIGLLWSPICFAAIFIHKSIISTSWLNSTVLLLPPMIIELFICLGTRFICKSSPVQLPTLLKSVLTHLFAAVILTGAWVLLVMIYSTMLNSITENAAWKILFTNSVPLLAGISISLYSISVLFHYLLLANEAARIAENEALNQRLYATQAELKVLKSTIHPHFLFNSLNSIGPLIDRSPDKARQFIEQLSDYFRYSLKYGGEKIVPVKDELTHIKDYLGIEAIRFGERLKIKYHVEEAVLEKPVLSLILLPIIENAIKHGISQCLTGGLLTISIFKDGDFISIKISNPYEKPARPTKGEGMGIRTLQQRLRFHYGSSATCIINKAKDTFSVTLLIPESMEKHNAS